jgi:hypothetical protein
MVPGKGPQWRPGNSASPRHAWVSACGWPLWRMVHETGARAEELLGLDVDDLDPAYREALVRGKGGDVEPIWWATGTDRLLTAGVARRTTGPLRSLVALRRGLTSSALAYASPDDPLSQSPFAPALNRARGAVELSVRRPCPYLCHPGPGVTVR